MNIDMSRLYLHLLIFCLSLNVERSLSRVITVICPVSLTQCRPHHDNEPTEMEVNENYTSVEYCFIFVGNMIRYFDSLLFKLQDDLFRQSCTIRYFSFIRF